MTTIYKNSLLLQSFKGRSPRQIYVDACREHNVRPQNALCELLSNIPDDFGKSQAISCPHILFGVRGCLALIPVIQSAHALRRLDLRGCGLTDEFIHPMVEALQDHPNIRSIDLSDNLYITVYSGKFIVKMVEQNQNIIQCRLDNTHIGANVAKVIDSRCQSNKMTVKTYFADEYFRMKNTFTVVDADGSGWVHIKNIIGSVTTPMVQERLLERIAIKRPKKRADHCINVNTFMELVYINYKSVVEIYDRAQDQEDTAAETIKKNWAKVLKALHEENLTCSNLSAWRIRNFSLSDDDAKELVQKASHNPAPEDPRGRDVSAGALLRVARERFPNPPPEPKGYYFLKERADDYVSPVLRSGSRIVSVNDLASGTQTPSASQYGADDRGEHALEDDDPPHTWKLSGPMVKSIVELFGDKMDVVADQLLEWKPQGELEYLRVVGACSDFARHSLPTDVTVLTLQEVVNMLDEYYDVLRVDKKFSLETVMRLASPYM
jgi:hypothetical protein